MPKIRRWFHVSHDINSDGEVWELTDQFGVAGLRLWLELLSIADRNEGALPSLSDSTVRQLSIKCNTSQTRVRGVLDFGLTRSWVVCDPIPRIRNWLNYNPSREDKKFPSPSPPNPPNLPNQPEDTFHKNEKSRSASPTPSASLKKKEKISREEKHMASMNLIPELKKEADRVYYSDRMKFKRLAVWINQGRKHGYSESDMGEALRQFWDYRMIDEWYPYLDTVLERVVAQNNGKATEVESERHKRELSGGPIETSGIGGMDAKGKE